MLNSALSRGNVRFFGRSGLPIRDFSIQPVTRASRQTAGGREKAGRGGQERRERRRDPPTEKEGDSRDENALRHPTKPPYLIS